MPPRRGRAGGDARRRRRCRACRCRRPSCRRHRHRPASSASGWATTLPGQEVDAHHAGDGRVSRRRPTRRAARSSSACRRARASRPRSSSTARRIRVAGVRRAGRRRRAGGARRRHRQGRSGRRAAEAEAAKAPAGRAPWSSAPTRASSSSSRTTTLTRVLPLQRRQQRAHAGRHRPSHWCSTCRAAPRGAGRVRARRTLAAVQDRRLTLTGPFPPGRPPRAGGYSHAAQRRRVRARRRRGRRRSRAARWRPRRSATLTLTSPQLTQQPRRRGRTAKPFVMGTAGRLTEGQALTLELSGLPHRRRWPRNVALALAGAARARRRRGRGSARRRTARPARGALPRERETLLGALAASTAQRRARGRSTIRAHARASASGWWPRSSRSTPSSTELPGGAGTCGVSLRLRPRRRRAGRAALRPPAGADRHLASRPAPATSSALLGPNGAGKSTLLAILGTLLAPSTGRVDYGGRHRARRRGAALRARIGMLGHDLFLYPELTARENLRLLRAGSTASTDAAARGARRSQRAGLDRPRRRCRVGVLARHAAARWRSSARCCTSRGCCCSTSRSPASTRRRPRRWSPGCASEQARRDRGAGHARSRCRRRPADARALFLRGGRLVGGRGRTARCASAIARVHARVMAPSSASRWLVAAQGPDRRGAQLRDAVDDAVLRRRRAC